MRRPASCGRRLRMAAAVGGLALAACDLGTSGPGTYQGTVTGDGLGAAVLEVTWQGVVVFGGQGDTQAYSGPVPGSPNRHRVVLLSPTGGTLHFAMTVDDRYRETPSVVVVEAAGTDNLPLSAGALRVVLQR